MIRLHSSLNNRDIYSGAWLISEYVYNPDGEFVGIVRQRRYYQQGENNRVKVVQRCEPDIALADHPMGRFRGEYIFEFSIEDNITRYHGPDKIGSSLSWGENAMIGRGLWPRFGHNFRSFTVFPEPEHQITSRKFFNATEMVANTISIAIPEENSAEPPHFEGPFWARYLSETWQGDYHYLTAAGHVLKETTLLRRYNGLSWEDYVYEDGQKKRLTSLELETWAPNTLVSGSMVGLAKMSGWSLEIEAMDGPSIIFESTEVLDGAHSHLVGFRRWYINQVLDHVEIIKLRPEKR